MEIPPGPPVLATLVAEIYGPSGAERDAYAGQVREAFRTTPGVVDIDSSLEPVTARHACSRWTASGRRCRA